MEGIWADGDGTNRFALAGLDHHAWILQLARKEESLFEDIDFNSMHACHTKRKCVNDVTDRRYSPATPRSASFRYRTG